ncbi:MAG: 6-hydroxymethylpterin diphosphokinase MptE-like protein [Planctomycetota bacterium]
MSEQRLPNGDGPSGELDLEALTATFGDLAQAVGGGEGAALAAQTAAPRAARDISPELIRNLSILSLRSPGVADAIRESDPAGDVDLFDAEDGGLTGAIRVDGNARSLASRRRPVEEGRRLAESVDLSEAGVAVVLGFGCGHHVASLASRIKGAGSVLVFEPDVAMLRAVLEREDFSEAFAAGDVRFLTDAENEAQVAASLGGLEALVSMGVKIVEHPPSRARLGAGSEDFGVTLARVVSSIKTNMVTTLMQSGVTIRNELMNLDRYAASAGFGQLRNAAAGSPAVVVSAGPSFRRNAHLLSQDWVRERVVIVAVQTVLKPLLDMGVRPHFVTALDHHEISARFYEGLTESDVEGITLVAEAKGNPAILEAFPGRIVSPADPFLDELLGQELLGSLGGDRPPIAAGATVAHLAYYLARYLGCNPVALVGQDLAFTDGQYYSAGAAIHGVWAPELNEFNTLEMMEWQRVARMGGMLQERTDTRGRRVYTDEQMATYLLQFEREFERDRAQGLRTIDATEGGVMKRGTETGRLEDFLADSAFLPALRLPAVGGGTLSREDRSALKRRVRDVRQEVFRVGKLSRETASTLREAGDDVAAINKAANVAHANRDRVRALRPAFGLVQKLNQTGALKRAKADRQIFLRYDIGSDSVGVATGDDAQKRQAAQRERDVTNLEWLGDAADELGRLLDSTVAAIDGKPKLTRAPRPSIDDDGARVAPKPVEAWAVLPTDVERDAFGRPRDLGTVVASDMNALRLTLRRLSRARLVKGVVIPTNSVETVARLLSISGDSGTVDGTRVRLTRDDRVSSRIAAVRGARGLSRRAWRGGLGFWTVWDETMRFDVIRDAASLVNAEAAVVAGPDWCLVCPELADAVVERFREDRGLNRFAFSQAPAGLAPLLIDAVLLDELVKLVDGGRSWGSMGSLLGFVPTAPAMDPIAKDACVKVSPTVRGVVERLIADSADTRRSIGTLVGRVGADASADELAAAIAGTPPTVGAEELVVTVADASGVMSAETLEKVVTRHAAGGQAIGVTLLGEPDALAHDDPLSLTRAARRAGAVCVHVRTSLLATDETSRARALSIVRDEGGADAVSCDLFAVSRESYAAITGRDDFESTRSLLEEMLRSRRVEGGVGVPWIVPRMTRRDAVIDQVEAFFSESLTAAGACVIDPMTTPDADGRISPLPVPSFAAARRERATVRIGVGGNEIPRGSASTGDADRSTDQNSEAA